ncbi:hypothetical protein K7X08_022054 [Anisodus acutangulus]|uniref:Uncharacterized protein n=1 Tax=Anisodus acutangulus TaxID=402998 RepID=A0A9Q1QVW7_9SOLA|nr:hypothetical protein K7X08_022054 [Anisodus acutangulus]
MGLKIMILLICLLLLKIVERRRENLILDALLFERIIKKTGSRKKLIGPSVGSHKKLLRSQSVNETSDIERSPDLVGGVQSPVDVVDSSPNDFGGEDFDGVDFGGEDFDGVDFGDVSEMQVESPVGDDRREVHDESINVAAETEQVSQQTAFSADGEDHIEEVAHENVDCATAIDEQTIVVYTDVVAEHPLVDTPVESADVVEGSVQSQGDESTEESDDDFDDIMDVASSAVDMTCDI